MSWEEFYNKVHSKKDGKFADTPGPGHAKGAPKATPAQAAALKKVLSGPKTPGGSVMVNGKVVKKVTKEMLAAAVAKKKAAALAASKPTPKPAAKSASKPKPAAKPTPKPEPKAKVSKEAAKVIKTKAPVVKATTKVKTDEGDSYGPEFSKTFSDIKSKDIYPMQVKLQKKPGMRDYELNGPEDDEPYGYIINAKTENYISLKKGQTIESAIKQLASKEGLDEVSAVKENSSTARIESILFGRGNRLGTGSIADNDDIGSGKAKGMNQSPPPSGVKQSKLTDDHIAAIGEYRGSAYLELNTALRKGKADGPGVKDIVADLDSAFKAASKTTKDIIVYRGVEIDLPKKFTDSAFSSTTYDQQTAKGFGTVIKIVIPKGSSVLKLSGGAEERHYGGESELLLPRGVTFMQQPDGSYLAKMP